MPLEEVSAMAHLLLGELDLEDIRVGRQRRVLQRGSEEPRHVATRQVKAAAPQAPQWVQCSGCSAVGAVQWVHVQWVHVQWVQCRAVPPVQRLHGPHERKTQRLKAQGQSCTISMPISVTIARFTMKKPRGFNEGMLPEPSSKMYIW